MVKSIGRPSSVRTEDEWKWRNLFVSWIHSCLSATWVLMCMLVYPVFLNDLIHHVNYFTYFCTCFGTGYFMYDFLDLLRNKKMKVFWQVAVHHVAVVSIFFYNIAIRAQIGFTLIALSVEVNSVFLHWRKLLQMLKTPFDSPKYVVIKHLNLL
ncbi:unnamed protein product, partial [Lymnaea stagnalis]